MTAGLLLAAGQGSRFGMPKALAVHRGAALVTRAADVLLEGGCDPVIVVLGARGDEARPLVPAGARAVTADDWAEGMGASLRAGLRALAEAEPPPVAALVHLVDLPDVGAEVVGRMRAHASTDVVARAAYADAPGHPVLFGRRWWAEIAAQAAGDRGARDWLRARDDVRLVDCGDIGGGRDADTPELLDS
ncbi:nucleotidyltransferase family protein [Prauserella halophila]|uniref:Nucleotidyltransferase family protein n=1 Tax=Prauserella halophila TaxID=185641 RepID=A0ABN1VVC7_9PSEU|nr:nucleotidyltransferase family protein [Prauserella halophila]MCP2234572.1 nicotine blue oxidoreductase [Prauserella halophila]